MALSSKVSVAAKATAVSLLGDFAVSLNSDTGNRQYCQKTLTEQIRLFPRSQPLEDTCVCVSTLLLVNHLKKKHGLLKPERVKPTLKTTAV